LLYSVRISGFSTFKLELYKAVFGVVFSLKTGFPKKITHGLYNYMQLLYFRVQDAGSIHPTFKRSEDYDNYQFSIFTKRGRHTKVRLQAAHPARCRSQAASMPLRMSAALVAPRRASTSGDQRPVHAW
jgi:hypothetical protein